MHECPCNGCKLTYFKSDVLPFETYVYICMDAHLGFVVLCPLLQLSINSLVRPLRFVQVAAVVPPPPATPGAAAAKHP